VGTPVSGTAGDADVVAAPIGAVSRTARAETAAARSSRRWGGCTVASRFLVEWVDARYTLCRDRPLAFTSIDTRESWYDDRSGHDRGDYGSGMQIEIHHLLADGDRVALHSRRWLPDGGPEIAVVDIWRIGDDGLIVEGWEIIEPVGRAADNFRWWDQAAVA
jgi:hypothetical protein